MGSYDPTGALRNGASSTTGNTARAVGVIGPPSGWDVRVPHPVGRAGRYDISLNAVWRCVWRGWET